MNKKMDIYAELDNFVEENKGQVTLTDVAKHFANYGYEYAIEKACEWFENNLSELVKDQEMIGTICQYMDKKVNIEKFRQFMEE